jgi:hypothetical protein
MGRHVLAGLSGAACVCLLFWLVGFDFNERGPEAAVCAGLSLFIGGCCFGASRDLSK